ncbi:hypothetical protein SMGD1_0851 [Sulfurimonas gotlandica GD1]|uniref:Uncharacterized protein n=1 Tax=Sulfurimonas gotlandica (strain DSM 19862 / JCM 16533 / GD1) TaxID=929558 RepID=H1FX68_SULGG|nr:hypothetical protein [Sulfurimonas gotlandica]EHP29378.1 hypothetical protein SMGD1_0851 [Sulfurimonas gotlandica GD1]
MYEFIEYWIVGIVSFLVGFIIALLTKKCEDKEELKELLNDVKSNLNSVTIHLSESETERMAMLRNQDNIQQMIEKLKTTIFNRSRDEEKNRIKNKKLKSIKNKNNQGNDLE